MPRTHLDAASPSSWQQGPLPSCPSQSRRCHEADLQLRPREGSLRPASSLAVIPGQPRSERCQAGESRRIAEVSPKDHRVGAAPWGPSPRACLPGRRLKPLPSTGGFRLSTAAHNRLTAEARLSADQIVKEPFLIARASRHNATLF